MEVSLLLLAKLIVRVRVLGGLDEVAEVDVRRLKTVNELTALLAIDSLRSVIVLEQSVALLHHVSVDRSHHALRA